MGLVYAAKAVSDTGTGLPEEWPGTWDYEPPEFDDPGWTFPGTIPGSWVTLPPGWPKSFNATLDMALPDKITKNTAFNIEVTVLDFYDDNTDILDNHYITIFAVHNNIVLGVKKDGDSEFASSISYKVTNYEGVKHGFSGSMQVDLSSLDYGAATITIYAIDMLTVNPVIYAVDTVERSYVATLNVIVPEDIEHDSDFNIEVRMLDQDGEDISELDGDYLTISAAISGTQVNIKKPADPSYSASISYEINNYADNKYGISEDIDLSLFGNTNAVIVTIFASIAEPVLSGNDTAEYNVLALVFTSYPDEVNRGQNITLGLKVVNMAGGTITSAAPATTLAISGADANDVISDSNILTGDWSSGTWSISDFQISGGSGYESGVTLTATAAGYETAVTPVFSIIDILGYFNFDFIDAPGVATSINRAYPRGEVFSIIIRIENENGSRLTSAAPEATLILNDAATGDELSKTTILSSDWIDGAFASNDIQITGGNNYKEISITVTANGYVSDTSDSLHVCGPGNDIGNHKFTMFSGYPIRSGYIKETGVVDSSYIDKYLRNVSHNYFLRVKTITDYGYIIAETYSTVFEELGYEETYMDT